ncbi:MAG TPA: alpha/beta hydrolase [Steroidobacteraceae bacterium]
MAHDRAVMPLRMGFADTLTGQLHFRACGAGPDIVLLPWSPASGRMYDHLLPQLARAGFRAIAFDLAGTGRSHKKCRNWTVQQYATDVLEACGSLHTVPYTVIGGRFGAAVAVEMLLAAPAQVTGAVLDGVPGLAPEELRKKPGPTSGLSPKIDSDGLRSFAFDVTVRMLKDWDPGFELTQETLPVVYDFMRDYLELGYDAIAAGVESDAKGAKPTYDVLARLGEVSQRVLVMTSDTDNLASAYNRALERARNSRGHKFAGNHPILTPARAAEYAQVVVSFARR